MMRMVSIVFLLTTLLSAEVDWRFAHPGADMLLGINLKNLKGSALHDLLNKTGGLSRDRMQMLENVDAIYVSVRTKYVKGRPSGEPLGVILIQGSFDNGDAMKMFEKQAKVSARFIDRRTIMLGDEESMAAAAERLKGDEGLVSPVISRAKELAASNDFWVVGSPAPFTAMKPRGSMKKQGGMASDLEQVFDNLRTFSLGVAMRNELSMDLGLNLRTKEAADQLMELYQRLDAEMEKTPEAKEVWEKMTQALEVHPNGTSVRFHLHGDPENFQAVLAQATRGLMPAAVPVQVAEVKPVAAPLPVVVVAPPVAVRRTVRVYGMETGYREIPTTR